MGETRRARVVLVATTALILAGCSGSPQVVVSGSSTVAPITEAVARDGRFTAVVAAEGTTDGFERFCRGETHVNDASEAIPGPGQPVDYLALCAEHDVEFIELPVALDAVSVVRHVDADFLDDLTLAELQEIWELGSEVRTWADIRPGWPDREIAFYGRPPGSGTFDWFTHRVTGETGAVRVDLRGTDDVAQLAGWVADDPDALAFMGVGNYLAADAEHRDLMSTVTVDGVAPGRQETVEGTYPLARPLFVYVATAALRDEPDLERFVEHYLDVVVDLLPSTYFYPLPADLYPVVRQRFDDRVTGSVFGGDPFRAEDVKALLGG